MSTTIRDATVAFGAVYGALLVPIQRRIVQYLQRNYYTPLIGDATLVPLRGTTSRALHDEVMAIGVPFRLVLTDFGEGDIMEGFLESCKHVSRHDSQQGTAGRTRRRSDTTTPRQRQSSETPPSCSALGTVPSSCPSSGASRSTSNPIATRHSSGTPLLCLSVARRRGPSTTKSWPSGPPSTSC